MSGEHLNGKEFRDQMYLQLEKIGKAIGSKVRLEMLDLLAQGPRSVESLARQIGQSVANTSQHLQGLRQARLVHVERQGTFAIYSLADPAVSDLVVFLRRLALQQLSDIADIRRRFFESHGGGVDLFDIEDLQAQISNGNLVVLDVRPADEYNFAHLPRAHNFPYDELPDRLHELPVNKRIVVYCRGHWSPIATQCIALMREQNLDVALLDGGVAEWRARGWQTESAPD